jgi:hypothetical protein
LLDIVCLNCTLDGATLVAEMRKPFDVLAEGLLSANSRDGGHLSGLAISAPEKIEFDAGELKRAG